MSRHKFLLEAAGGRGLWRDAYQELLSPRTVAVALTSVTLFTVAMTIFGPLGTLALGPLSRFAYWALCAGVTFPLCYALAAVVLYLTRLRSLIEMVPAVVAAVLFEGLLCTAVVIAADSQFLPARAPPLNRAHTYLTVTIVVAVCTFFTHYVVFLRILHSQSFSKRDAAGPARSPDGAAAGRAPGTTTSPGTTGPSESERTTAPVSERPADRKQLTPQSARFHDRLPRAVSRDVVYLKMDDHYVNVHTTGGSGLVLMRFGDAVADLGALGMRVHRSYWVAHRHMLATVRRDGRTMLRVTGGQYVPVSRPYLPAVREALRAKPPRPARGERNE